MTKNIFFWISFTLVAIFWPISFYRANTDTWISFFIPALVLLMDWCLYLRQVKYHYFIFLVLPLLNPVYLAFPFIYFLISLKEIPKKIIIIFSLCLLILTVFSYRHFYAYSIFTPDPFRQDTLIKKISLIPSRTLARVFENKATVPLDKYTSNFFTSMDLNNYFFALHPRENADNQILDKAPLLALIPFLIGFFYLSRNKHRKWLGVVFLSAVLSFAFINNQDRYDFLVFFPFILLIYFGLLEIKKWSNPTFALFTLVFIPSIIFELLRNITYR